MFLCNLLACFLIRMNKVSKQINAVYYNYEQRQQCSAVTGGLWYMSLSLAIVIQQWCYARFLVDVLSVGYFKEIVRTAQAASLFLPSNTECRRFWSLRLCCCRHKINILAAGRIWIYNCSNPFSTDFMSNTTPKFLLSPIVCNGDVWTRILTGRVSKQLLTIWQTATTTLIGCAISDVMIPASDVTLFWCVIAMTQMQKGQYANDTCLLVVNACRCISTWRLSITTSINAFSSLLGSPSLMLWLNMRTFFHL